MKKRKFKIEAELRAGNQGQQSYERTGPLGTEKGVGSAGPEPPSPAVFIALLIGLFGLFFAFIAFVVASSPH